MPQSGQVTVVANDVTQLSNANIGTSAAVMVQNKGPFVMHILPTTDATEPALADVAADGLELLPGQGVNDTLAALFPDGLTYVRLWATAPAQVTAICYHA